MPNLARDGRHIFGFFIFAFILISIPLTVISVIQQRDSRSKADVGPNHPNDPCFDGCVDLATGATKSQWDLKRINAEQAWGISKGTTSTKVAVIGTGVNPIPEIDSKLVTGYNTVYNNTDTSDDFGSYGQGTELAAIIGAETNNSSLIAGLNWNVTILPVKACISGVCNALDVAEGVDWARTNGAKVIVIGNTYAGTSVQNSAAGIQLTNSINAAVSAGVMVVAASGGANTVAGLRFPANIPNAISVGATKQGDLITTFTGSGPEMDLVAPGEGIYTVVSNGGGMERAGTHDAAAHVAGVGALLMSLPGIDNVKATSCLTSSATDLGVAGKDSVYGFGLVNAYAAVQACNVNDTTPPTAASKVRVLGQSNKVKVAWDAATDNIGVVGYDVYHNTTKLNTSLVTGLSFNYSTTDFTGNYSVKAYDAVGNMSLVSSPLAVVRACTLVDVSNDNTIDYTDTQDVLDHFGSAAGSIYDMDPENSNGVDLTDALITLDFFGEGCS